MYTKFIGDVSVPLELNIINPLGIPVTGAVPTLKIRRQSDNYYLDFDDNIFKNTGWASPTHVMNEVGSTYAPGLYQYIWDTHVLITMPGNYAAEYTPNIANYAPDVDYLTFVYDFATSVGDIIVEGVGNPIDLKTAIKEIHVYTSGEIDRNPTLGSNTYKDSDGIDVYTLTPGLTERNRS